MFYGAKTRSTLERETVYNSKIYQTISQNISKYIRTSTIIYQNEDKIYHIYVCINLWGSNNDEDIRIYVYGAKTRSTLEREYHINFEGDENYLLF